MAIIKVLSQDLGTSMVEVTNSITEMKEMDLIVLRQSFHWNKTDCQSN